MALLVLESLFTFFAMRATEPAARVRVPYSPFFVEQVRADHVASISSKGTAIQGTFTKKLSYDGSKPTAQFRTEVPAFANTDALSNLLQEHGVTVNAKPVENRLPWWQNVLLGFGPTILFVLLFFWLLRRGANARMRSDRLDARPRAGTSRPATESRSRTWRGSTRPRPS